MLSTPPIAREPVIVSDPAARQKDCRLISGMVSLFCNASLGRYAATPFLRGIVSIALRVIGIIAILVGLIWIGQGSGYFPYPSRSFMINQMAWVYRGAILTVLGVVVVGISRLIA